MATILIADDDSTFVSAVRHALEGKGYTIITAESGPGALKMFTDHQPELSILGVRLPEMDGLEVCRKIRFRSSAPVFLMAAPGDADVSLQGLEAGADQYFSKPLPMREFLARVQAIFRRLTLDRSE